MRKLDQLFCKVVIQEEIPSKLKIQFQLRNDFYCLFLFFSNRFSLQTRRGGLVKVYDSALNSNSQYKSLLISARTTVDELIALLLNCYSSKERVEQFSLYEVNPDKEQQRKLHPDDSPLQVQQMWLPSSHCHFLVRRNPEYLPLSRSSMLNFMRLPHSRYKSAHLLQLSKSHTSLTPPKKQEEKVQAVQNSFEKLGLSKTRSADTKRFVSSTQLSTTQLSASKLSGSPSYADYENYFYI